MKTAVRAFLLLASLALFGWFLHRAGPAEILRTCASLGWFAPVILLPYGMVFVADTLGWRFAFGGDGAPKVSFWNLYRIRWCGEAVNNVIPSTYIGGEAVKVYLLRKRGVPLESATASVIVGRTVQTLTQVMFTALGAAAFLTISSPYPGLRLAMTFVLVGSVAAVVILFWMQSHGLSSILLRTLRRLGIRMTALESRQAELERIDRRVMAFYRNDLGHFLFSACGYFVGWLLDTLEVFLVAWLLGMPIEWTHALAIEAFVGVAKILGLFVPGALGVQESGIALVCRLLGLPDALGLSYAILRRGREAVYASLGWLLLYLEEATLKGLSGKITSASTEQP